MLNDIKVVSFDADGTIVESSYVNSFWFEALPKLYAEKNGIEFEKAKEILSSQYDALGDEDIRWYQPRYWFNKFGLSPDPKDVIQGIQIPENVNHYEDAVELIQQLRGKHRLIVTSNAPRIFLDYGLKGVDGNFSEVYSCVSDFGAVKKDESVYRKITNQLGIKAEEMIHVGDHWKFDYQVPRNIGIKAFYIDRAGNKDSDGKAEILRDLRELTRTI